MKTLAVLSALATIAIAAPSGSLTSNDFTINQQREKKSTLVETVPERTLDHLEDHVLAKPSSFSGPSNSVGRTFSGFKKPIIVKKKIGYHVYRDSDEEQAQADSRESCKKQIKVKLCDDNNSVDKMKSATIDHMNDEMSESEMKHTINMAREAVETFQRDLEKMEHDSVENIDHKHTTFIHDKELHKDIEKARQALEHIKEKFKNFDTTATVNDDSEHLKIAESDDIRMAQWKGAGNDHKHLEISRNMEDVLKLNNRNDVPLDSFKSSTLEDAAKDVGSIATIEDINTPASSTIRKAEDSITSVIEDKETLMNIPSDNLIKDNSANEDVKAHSTTEEDVRKQENVDNVSTQPKNSELKSGTEGNDHEKLENSVNKNKGEREIEYTQLERHTSDNEKKHTINDSKNRDKNEHSVEHLKSEESLNNGHLQSIERDVQLPQESKQTETVLRPNSKTYMRSGDIHILNEDDTTDTNQNKAKENHVNHFEQKSTLSQKSSTDLNLDSHHHNNMHHEANAKETSEDIHLHRSSQKHASTLNSEEILNHGTGSHKSLEANKDLTRSTSSLTPSELDNKKTQFHEHGHNKMEKIDDHEVTDQLRATSDFHKTLLNNMDFVEDMHESSFHKPSVTQNSHLMHSSDNPEHKSNQRAQLKMAPTFNNDQPNFNVQFNTPETFVQQTNEQTLIPFKSASEFQDRHLHDRGEMLSDPLKVRWAHENNLNLEKLKAAHFQEETMKMDGSSQHFNVDKSMPFRATAMDNHHLDVNGQFNAQQRWSQAKGINSHMRMMHEKSNLDSSMQPNSFMHMRGAPKTNLEFTNSNQWNHNHGAFRSSYGPSMPASYGTGGGSSSGGSAVGLFPNANVGNCAVPILLSCSPSVVSGSLAKTNTYNAPSYRSEDMNLVKRNTKIDDVNSLKLHRHIPLSHKPNIVLESKHQ